VFRNIHQLQAMVEVAEVAEVEAEEVGIQNNLYQLG
jgi:hypothetical protein